MDFRVSRKEARLEPSGPAEVLVSDVFDLYPVFHPVDGNLITDVEVLDDDREERLDRAMFAAVKQQGQDPLAPEEGIPYAQAFVEDITIPALLPYITRDVQAEGPGVRVSFETLSQGGRDYLAIKVGLTDAA
jgi:hypothetical protein